MKKVTHKKKPSQAWMHVLQHHDHITEIHSATAEQRDKLHHVFEEEYSPEHSHNVSGVPVFRSHADTRHNQHVFHSAAAQLAKKRDESNIQDSRPSIRVNVTRKTKKNATNDKASPSKIVSPVTASSPRPEVPIQFNPTVPVGFHLSKPVPRVEKKPEVKGVAKLVVGYTPKNIGRTALHPTGTIKDGYAGPKHPHTVEHGQVFNHTCEQVLSEQLLRMMTLLLKAQLAKTSHDPVAVGTQMRARAAELVENELNSINLSLLQVQGPSASHKNHAMSQLCVKLTNELQREIFTDERALHRQKALSVQIRTEEKELAHNEMAKEVAAKDQEIAKLRMDLKSAHFDLQNVGRTNEVMEKELNKLNQLQSQFNQNAVELRMQGLDFKSRVNNKCNRVLHAIQTRMGFVPEVIAKEVSVLQGLKAPGDPHYSDILDKAYTKHSLRAVKALIGDIPVIITDQDEQGDIYVEPLSGKRLHTDGTPADVQTQRQQQVVKDFIRHKGLSPGRPSHSHTHTKLADSPRANTARASASAEDKGWGIADRGEARARSSSRDCDSRDRGRADSKQAYSGSPKASPSPGAVRIPYARAEAKSSSSSTTSSEAYDAKYGIAEKPEMKSDREKSSRKVVPTSQTSAGASADSSSSDRPRHIHGRGRAPRSQEDWVQWAVNEGVGVPRSMRQPGSFPFVSSPSKDDLRVENMQFDNGDDSDSDYVPPSHSSSEESESDEDDDDDDDEKEEEKEEEEEDGPKEQDGFDIAVKNILRRRDARLGGVGKSLDSNDDDYSADTYTTGKQNSFPAGTFQGTNRRGPGTGVGFMDMQSIYPGGASIQQTRDGNVISISAADLPSDDESVEDNSSSGNVDPEDASSEDHAEMQWSTESGANMAELREFIRNIRQTRGINDSDIAMLNEAMMEMEEDQRRVGSSGGSWGARR